MRLAREAIQHLTQALEELQPLKPLPRGSDQYNKWVRDTRVALQEIFKDDDKHAEEFIEALSSRAVVLSGMTDADWQAEYVGALDRADTLLRSMIDEVRNFGLPPNSRASTAVIDVDTKKLSLAELGRLISRLSVASLSVVSAAVVAVFSAGVWAGTSKSGVERARLVARVDSLHAAVGRADSALAADQAADDNFVNRFASDTNVDALSKIISDDNPDGLKGHDDVRASLLWQVRSRDGAADFYRGDSVFQLQVSYSDSGLSLTRV
jgi:hypothetical protein